MNYTYTHTKPETQIAQLDLYIERIEGQIFELEILGETQELAGEDRTQTQTMLELRVNQCDHLKRKHAQLQGGDAEDSVGVRYLQNK